MAAEQLQIKVQADVQNAVSGLNNLNKSLEQTNKAAVSTGTAGMGNLTKGSNQATFALQNFGRVASDAPFGIIGIANNIDPLVQSFVTLRKETGSNKAALAALTSSLTGGGGLILAVSLVTSALQFAQIGLSRWGASSKKAKEEQDELAKSFGQQYTQVLLLRKAYEQDKSLEGRREILSQLNQISDKYFGNLKAEETSIKQLENAYKGYIDNLLQSFAVKQLEQNLEPLVKQLAVQESTIKKLQPTVQKLGLAYKDLTGLTGADLESAKRFNKDLQESFRNLSTEQRKALAPSGVLEYNQAVGQSETLWKQINKLIEDATLLYSPLDKKGKDNKATIDDITKLLSKYREELKGINWDEQNRQIDGTNERVKLAGETLKSLYLAGVKETSAAWQQVNRDLKEFQAAQDYKQFREGLERVNAEVKNSMGLNFDLNKEISKGLKESIKLIPQVSKGTQNLIDLRAKYLQTEKENLLLQQQLAATIQGALSPAIDAIFQAFEDNQNPFDALIDSLRQFTIELGKAIVKQLLFNAISNAIAPGAGAAAGGIGNFLGGFVRGDQLRLGVTR